MYKDFQAFTKAASVLFLLFLLLCCLLYKYKSLECSYTLICLPRPPALENSN